MAKETEKKLEKTHDEILAEFRALKTHAERVKYFQANREVLRQYISEGCYHQ